MTLIRDTKTEIHADLDQIQKCIRRAAMELYEDHPAQEMLAWAQEHLARAQDNLDLLTKCCCTPGDS